MEALIIFTAKYLIALPLIIVFYLIFTSQKRLINAFFAFVSLFFTYILGKIGSHFYYDPRPFVVKNITPLINHVADNGFPSDHMLLAASLAAVGTFLNRKIGVLLWIIALLIGFSRVLAHVHHLTDILGSMIFALISTYVVYLIFKKRKVI